MCCACLSSRRVCQTAAATAQPRTPRCRLGKALTAMASGGKDAPLLRYEAEVSGELPLPLPLPAPDGRAGCWDAAAHAAAAVE